MKRIGLVVAVVVVLLVGAVAWALSRSGDSGGTASAPPSATPTPTPSPASVVPTRAASPSCPTSAKPFAPTSITVPGVARNTAVITPPRDANDVPGTPPLTDAGKAVFAFDREQGVRPGDTQGNVLLNAHTYPDGSALGNRLLLGLARGSRIVVRDGGERLCYRVTQEVQVLATDGLADYYAKKGKPQLAIVVCSGRRLGAGQWEKRTIWFASPSA